VYNQKRKLTKNLKYKIVDLSADYNSALELSKCLTDLWRKKTKKTIKILNKQDQLGKDWVKYGLPEWQSIWYPRGIKIKYNQKQKTIFLSIDKKL
jgi:hypothetical protein